MFNYIVREKCAVTDEVGFEPLFRYDFPLFCGCTNLPQSEDIIAKMDFVIAKISGVIELKNLIPLDLLYQNGHDAGAVYALWSSHHAKFADFVMSFSPKNVLEMRFWYLRQSPCISLERICFRNFYFIMDFKAQKSLVFWIAIRQSRANGFMAHAFWCNRHKFCVIKTRYLS